MSYEKVEDTFFEAFEGKYVRALITGPNEKIVRRAAFDSTSTPSAVIGRVEGGVEGFLSGEDLVLLYNIGLVEMMLKNLHLNYLTV